MRYEAIENAPFGVEVFDFNPREGLSSEHIELLNRLFDLHRLILLRGNDVGNDAHIALVNAIEPAVREGATDALFSINSTVRKDAYIPGRAALPFHSDYLFSSHGPIQVVSLAALKLEIGEPTMFTDSVAAARRLPPELEARLQEMELVQCQSWAVDVSGEFTDLPRRLQISHFDDVPREQLSIASSPALRRHPRTGEKVLMHSECMTSHVRTLGERESLPFFDLVMQHQYDPADTYTHHWREGDLVIWDNFALQHGRPALAKSGERLLRRVAGNRISIREVMDGVIPGRLANVTVQDNA
ncbi:TauD/TfdA dioxygenase family protein [Sphingopyxis flava]|uniref:Taurine dioxygenase, alpha-ketoglutarate-dependent n=1 Tax=Sphingopyxis flava TaxID=1507287 RepID=A0A1T5FMA7_9SPHN|nr:TauD/TfdA family dioxygenase [Sphingopyxis flava]SKB97228.1 Taurine dioxygenase, alpha-ketoglutarate-dependent [Sphingopyxis flava]